MYVYILLSLYVYILLSLPHVWVLLSIEFSVPVDPMKAYCSLTTVIDGGDRSALRSGRFTSRERTQVPNESTRCTFSLRLDGMHIHPLARLYEPRMELSCSLIWIVALPDRQYLRQFLKWIVAGFGFPPLPSLSDVYLMGLTQLSGWLCTDFVWPRILCRLEGSWRLSWPECEIVVNRGTR
jgi:hypothetical protein